ncbi:MULTISPECIES: DUF6119 family protein [unclassified Corynebacterium]|uniref:DUF6119 family protein n=1 Tax=unclassified Corynebacterium TaxID=2624378 RepID=UPI000B0EB44D|nr:MULTISPECIES: DUF6119 family protein [unclassified Corynebacterium]
MAGKKSKTASYTLYKLTGNSNLKELCQKKYLDRTEEFCVEDFELDERNCLLVHGEIRNNQPSWVEKASVISGKPVRQSNVTSSGLILIPDSNESTWALAFGMGYLLISPEYIDHGFGQRIAARTINPDKLKSVTKTILDNRSKTDRSSIPSGDTINRFEVGDFGEIVSRIKGAAVIPELTAGEKEIQVRGSDSLSIPLGKSRESLLKDLNQIGEILHRAPKQELEILDQLTKIRNKSIISYLDAFLFDEFDNNEGRMGLSWPDERIDDTDSPGSWKLYGFGRRKVKTGTPDLDDLIEIISEIPQNERVSKVPKISIQLFRDDEAKEAISRKIPIKNWITFEADFKGKRHCFYNGSWFEVSSAYLENLDKKIEKIFNKSFNVQFPVWKPGLNEAAYNRQLADSIGGICLDADLIRTEAHPKGVEVADVFLDKNVLIHVKQFDRSSPASHLIAQAQVSAETLYYDDEAWNKFKEKCLKAGMEFEDRVSRPKKIVLAMAGKGKVLNAKNLFSFTKVTLNRCVTLLERQGFEVFVVSIHRE